ncbi:hypothetical protein KY284_020968 [Solanum tuberosum]|nr:hypothetical protein KY284_020968 [Solanum tuberosum]
MDGHCPLPQDIMVDILSRLPVESLLSFKCVCKHWFSLIKSASFKEKHFHQKNNCARLLVCNFKVAMAEHFFVKSVEFSLLPKKIVPDVIPEQKVLLHLPRVLWIRDYKGQDDDPHVSVCVYSSCDNSWKDLEFPSSYTSSWSFDASYLNGVYYWRSLHVNEMYRIHSFDMGSEQFGEMQLPVIPNEHWWMLTLRGDSLAMLASDKSMTSIYEMKQKGSWSKVLTVQPPIDPHRPYDIWENDKIIFKIRQTSQLVLYDPTTSEVADLGIDLDRIGCCVFNYKESLALIKSGDETQDQDNVVDQIEHFFDMIPTNRKSLFTVRGPPTGW